MGRSFFFGVIAFLLILVGRTLFSEFSYVTDLFGYGFALYLLFYSKGGVGFLIGTSIGVELLGTARFGQGALLALVILILSILFAERLRFTSRFPRYIVALLIMNLSYSLTLLSPRSLLTYAPLIAITFGLFSIVTYFLAGTGKETDYELI